LDLGVDTMGAQIGEQEQLFAVKPVLRQSIRDAMCAEILLSGEKPANPIAVFL